MAAHNLAKLPTRAPADYHKTTTLRELKKLRQELIDLQDRLYAENKHSVLVILQGMDASGKDGLIRRVFSGINPQGVRVFSFKEPTELELSHDFLWRIHQQVPPRGMMQVFNRSHYEDVLITRVEGLVTTEEARRRFSAINAFEKLLQQAGTTVLKFYLHVSETEQQERLQERLTDATKQWKYEHADHRKAGQYPQYQAVYEDVFHACNPTNCPWHIVPADQNWYKAYVVALTLRDALLKLNPKYPKP
ncbi:PPK2 family polyphosphate kinase [Hymenobacter swuensis]|uniref:Polyphosphate:AMP phosphotransferase family protein n=1 Tax=Hymenobacter swuensis DY53 TaxID=1227739 RepID=W8ESY3_9BACT|nr:PPK2 family polyphosphate kinase [Hymenobacter swuensis]AHJ95638.1 Polyphosphate:AMP phosphotransferase family protein [Hymenobacter swuensis DY53]